MKLPKLFTALSVIILVAMTFYFRLYIINGPDSNNTPKYPDTPTFTYKYKLLYKNRPVTLAKKSMVINMKYLLNHIPFKSRPIFAEENNRSDFVFVTASSHLHYAKLIRLIYNIKDVFSKRELIVYDLGMESSQILSVKKFSRVELRSFNFQAYPPHVQRLQYYSFKPLIILEVLRSYPSVFWVDTSIVFHNPNNLTMMLPQSIFEKPLSMFDRCGHTVYQSTAPQTYDYLATDIDRMKTTECLGANAILIYNTEQLFHSVIFPWALCALVKECMAPIDTLHCDFKQYWGWARCHRFDQSVINILIYNMMGYNESRVWNKNRLKILDVRR